MKLGFTWRALDDLARLHAFIATKDPFAARRVSEALRNSIEHLQDHPQLGELFDGEAQVRHWVAGDYVTYYRAESEIVWVLRVFHGRERQTPGE